ncbi:MAG TPA: CDP-alcohol phosphatidyltransferase family protein [Myxococcota bacterium]
MTLLERLLHGLLRSGAALSEVRVELPDGAGGPPALPRKLGEGLPLVWSERGAPPAQRLESVLREAAGEPLLALAADSVVDARVIEHLIGTRGSFAFVAGEGAERGAALRLECELRAGGARDLLELAEAALRSGRVEDFAKSGFDGYIADLRRELPPYLFRVSDAASRDRAEHFLFWSNYKGSTDFLTRYVYPPLVWRAVRPLARWRVHPNWVTAASWLGAFGAVPLFAAGAWLPGLALAYGMSVLDSVDGKLARLSFTYSKFGTFFDHGLDIIHPPIWYMAWGWCLGGGDPVSAPFRASLWLLGVYTVDRIVTGLFRSRTGRSVHGYTPLDEKLRTFLSRRNVNLAFFTVALLVDGLLPGPGHPVASITFYAIVAWQVVCFLWHVERLVQYWNPAAQRSS